MWKGLIPVDPIGKGFTLACDKVVPKNLEFLHSSSLSLKHWNHVCSSSPKTDIIMLNLISVEISWMAIQNSAIALNLVRTCSWFLACQPTVWGMFVGMVAIVLMKLPSDTQRKHMGRELYCLIPGVVLINGNSVKLRTWEADDWFRHTLPVDQGTPVGLYTCRGWPITSFCELFTTNRKIPLLIYMSSMAWLLPHVCIRV